MVAPSVSGQPRGDSMSRELRVGRAIFRTAVALVAGGLVVVGLQSAGATGHHSKPTPAQIVVDDVFSALTAPDGTPEGAVPHALVVAGGQFSVTVSFYDAEGQPAAFKRDTTLAISTNTGPGNLPSPATGTAPGGATSVTLTSSLPKVANQVQVTVSAETDHSEAVTPGTSSPDQWFDVLAELRLEASAAGTPFTAGIGGDSNCTSATPANPVCGTLKLPNGAQSAQVLLSRGPCDAGYADCRSNLGSVIQFLGDLDGLYTAKTPASMIVKCDKSLCGSGAIKKYGLSYSLLGNAALAPAPTCPKKNRIGAGQEVCVDYVQSTRDNAGDTHLVLLLTGDARISVS